MNSTIVKTVSFFVIIGAFVGIASGISAAADEAKEKPPVDTRPLISTVPLETTDYSVKLSAHGEVTPLEKTILSAQVSGEILNWNPNFVAGGIVKRGEVLFTIEPDKYEADVLQAEAQVSLAEATLTEELARQKVAEQEAKHLARSQVSDLYLRKPQVLSAQAQLKSAQAALRIAKRNLNKTKVVAPYDALVISREVGAGQYVSAGLRVAELNNIETAEIIVPVPGFDRPFLKDDMTGVTALAKAQGNLEASYRTGFVDRDLGVLDQNTRMMHLVVQINDPYGLQNNQEALKFGSYVEVSFAGKTIENVYQVPQSLVHANKLWLVDSENKLQSHKVKIIREEGTFFFVTGDFTQNARLAQNLPEYPQNGMDVRIKTQEKEQDLLTFNRQ
ncbi:efflux RND transporter periplasmic adaptor subunit [Glaciecola sp. 1036]|uniref:efflux RND transporter periplasmic adaptor subunit n=1 Tax=Alteromonadaceae TaxID=72275 RepID=UPI003D05759C